MKTQQREQVGENLRMLAVELLTQIDLIDLSLARTPGRKLHVDGQIIGVDFKIPNFSDLGLAAKDPFVAEIRNQPGFTWLISQPDFKLAYEHFEKKIEKTKISEGEVVLLKTRFLHSFSGSGYLAYTESSFLPKTILKKEKTRAIQLAKDLLAFVEEGIGRPDFSYMDELRYPLRRFIDYFDKNTRREYSADRPKYVLTNLALCLHGLGLEEKDVVILVDYGVVIFEFDRSHRQVQRYVSTVFSTDH